MDDERRREEIVRAINALPEHEREFMLLYYFEGVECREIANRLGTSEGGVMQVHRRAMRMLRDRLPPDAGGSASVPVRPRDPAPRDERADAAPVPRHAYPQTP